MQPVPNPRFTYHGTVLFVVALGFLFLSLLINAFGIWKEWYATSEGAGWLLFGNIVLASGFFLCLGNAIAMKLAKRQYCPTCNQRIK